MTIQNTLRDHGQRHRPRMACLGKAESLVLEMQDPQSGVKSQPQRLVITTIPHAVTGLNQDQDWTRTEPGLSQNQD